jgi:Holliday junction DNA helicase RuvA
MYDFLTGKVVCISEKFIVLDVNNIGYKIYMCNTESIKLNYYIKIFIYYFISDSTRQLYGFLNKIEKEVFIKLLEIKKIGIKSAYLILKKYNYDYILNLVNNENKDELLKIPKINSNNINLFIKKLSEINYKESININSEILSILRSLDYKDKDIFKIYKSIDTNQEINDQIKQAITLLEDL